MARVVEVRNVDDVDGSEADETVTYAVDGIEYQIDLSAENAEKFRDTFAPWVEKSRRAPSRRGGRRQSAAKPSPTGRGKEVDSAQVRDWARANGIDVSAKGRLPASLVEQFLAAQQT